jgi:hypothetical protein
MATSNTKDAMPMMVNPLAAPSVRHQQTIEAGFGELILPDAGMLEAKAALHTAAASATERPKLRLISLAQSSSMRRKRFSTLHSSR